jgi:hypothetical protein
VPAFYAGAVIWPNGAYADVWLGINPTQAAITAEMINRVAAEAQGVSKVTAAFTYGRAVIAPGDAEQFEELSELERLGEVPRETVRRVDACLRETNTGSHPLGPK